LLSQLYLNLDKEKNKEVVERETQHNQFWWKMFGGAALFSNTIAFIDQTI
jgi:hypothetical protein